MNREKLLTQVLFLALLILLFSLDGCFLFPDSSTKETLPPATQTGANTFGCYVNGMLWLPKGYNGTSNLSSSYDPNFNGKPIFNIQSYRIVSDADRQYFGLYINGINNTGIYDIKIDTIASASFSSKTCNYQYYDSSIYRKGSITITKLDIVNAIISGTFQVTLFKTGCDSIKFTQGRFDMKL